MSEQAVVVHIPLSNDEFGTEEEQEAAFALDEELAEAVDASGAGEFDGNEFGGGECVFFMYGPNADLLYALVRPILRARPIAARGYAIKRYGESDDPNAAEVRVTWDA
jgi:hypothetical protein